MILILWKKNFELSHLALWKIKSNEYVNINLKNWGYDAFIRYCKKVFPGAVRNFVYKKIQNLRGCFRKELKKIVSLKSTVAARNNIYDLEFPLAFCTYRVKGICHNQIQCNFFLIYI